MKNHFIWAVPIMLSASVCFSETTGTITAAIDGEEQVWYLTEIDEESQSNWIQMMPGSLNMASASMWGNPSEDALGDTKGALLLTVTLIKGPSGFNSSGELLFLEEGFSRYWAANADAISFEIQDAVEESGSLRVSGTFEATAVYTEGAGATVVDTSNTKSVSGSFKATLKQ